MPLSSARSPVKDRRFGFDSPARSSPRKQIGAATPASPSKSEKPAPSDDEVGLEFRSTRIEPMAKIDTDEFKGGRQMTRKVANWFQSVGRAGLGGFAKPARSEGR